MDVLKRHSLAFLLSLLSCFFCLDSFFWHGLARLNLVISTQHHYSAQIDFDMHEFELFLFSHALRYHQTCVWYQMKEEKMPFNLHFWLCQLILWNVNIYCDSTSYILLIIISLFPLSYVLAHLPYILVSEIYFRLHITYC